MRKNECLVRLETSTCHRNLIVYTARGVACSTNETRSTIPGVYSEKRRARVTRHYDSSPIEESRNHNDPGILIQSMHDAIVAYAHMPSCVLPSKE